jgi:putative intracellular protease/amidase
MSSTSFTIHEARSTGVEIVQEEDALLWQGSASGKCKPVGPLAGKRIGLLVASEFSDFQAYYLVLYLSELGATVEFLEVGWIRWKHTRPNVRTKGVQGMWGMSINPIPVIPMERYGHLDFKKAQQEQYDGLIVLGEHSGDLLMSESSVQDFLRQALVMETIGTYTGKEVERDKQVITACGTEATPAFVGEIVRMSDTKYFYHRQNVLSGKKIAIIAGEDFEDVELVVTVMEFLYRGAEVTLATFPAPLRARPPMLGLDVTMGNFGISVPFQEIPETVYRIKRMRNRLSG